MPDRRLATIAQIQQAISDLLTSREPEFLRIGLRLFLAIALIRIGWAGVRWMFSKGDSGALAYEGLELLALLTFNAMILTFYERPLPGVGVSFSNLITDSTAALANLLDARGLEQTFAHLDVMWSKFVQPGVWDVFLNLLYWSLLVGVFLTKAVALGVVALGLIFSAVCALVGPLFLPFLSVPALNWIFWGWLKAFVQFSFLQVVTFAYLMVGERFIYGFVSTLPDVVIDLQFPLYIGEAFIVIGTFFFGILLVPSLNSALFSGHGHAGNSGFVGFVLRR